MWCICYIHMLVDRLSEEGHSCVCLAINDINLLDDDFSAYSSKTMEVIVFIDFHRH